VGGAQRAGELHLSRLDRDRAEQSALGRRAHARLDGRPGRPADLTGLAIYLASRASDFTTGQTFYVDGGFMAGGQW